jgi:anti-sigma factor RsiW
MIRTTCNDCRSHLIGYLHQQLSPRKRRQVAQHLQSCAACYADYIAQRDLARELTSSVPALGQPAAPDLSRVWIAIQRDMSRSDPVRRRYLGHYGIACLILALTLLLPWSLGQQHIALAVPRQPSAPAVLSVTEAAGATEEANMAEVAMVSATDAVIPPAETPSAVSATPVSP